MKDSAFSLTHCKLKSHGKRGLENVGRQRKTRYMQNGKKEGKIKYKRKRRENRGSSTHLGSVTIPLYRFCLNGFQARTHMCGMSLMCIMFHMYV